MTSEDTCRTATRLVELTLMFDEDKCGSGCQGLNHYGADNWADCSIYPEVDHLQMAHPRWTGVYFRCEKCMEEYGL